ncbi:MAG: hypothetical protein CMH31_01630 [Micavibrio sp.]|nr:hypothetical protein [Micavibrio sp.]
MSVNPTHINTQSGNILIYILGAIVLIGLLTIMVKGSSTPGSGIDREALEIRVAEVQAYGNELERAVSYVLRNGYSETDIRFAHPNHSSAYGDITDDPARQIFAREGGGATWRDNESDIQTQDEDWLFNGRNRVIGIGTTEASISSSELVSVLPYVTKDFCLLVNDKNNITNTSNNPPQDDNNVLFTPIFSGTFTFAASIGDAPTDYLHQKNEGCFEGETNPPAGTYHYYRVLLAR